ncbi:MAG TPA: PIN domain-containing protein [Pirellulales bacterium]|nr:PIN domain-containing protein [Pirellulales bacterium]
MPDAFDLIERYRAKGILVDANLLLLYFVGKFDSNGISTFKRTSQFNAEDFNLLDRLLKLFKRVVTTPNVLAEVNSLSGQWGEPAKSKYFQRFASEIETVEEEYIQSRVAGREPLFVRVGLTDTTIALAAHDRYLVLTDDFKLAQLLEHRGLAVLNFNHIRAFAWE